MPVKYFRKAYTSFATHVYDVPARMLAFLILISFSILPLVGLDPSKLSLLTTVNVVAIFAVSWDLLVGRAGQISLGHALFFGIGAYGAATLFKFFGWPIWIAIPISLLINVGIAVLVGLPCLRVKGPYLALITFSFPLAITGFLYYFRTWFRADAGIKVPQITLFFPYSQQAIASYYLTLSLMAISAFTIYKIANSKTGVVFVSILDDELASKACGINVTKYKLMAFAISGLFASLAGCLFAYLFGGASPSLFDVSYSILPLIVTILGGIGTIYGPLVGIFVYYLLNYYVFTDLIRLDQIVTAPGAAQAVSLLIFLSVVVIFVIKWPRGIGRAVVEKLEDLEEPREIEEIETKKVKRFRRWRNARLFLTRRLRRRKEKGET